MVLVIDLAKRHIKLTDAGIQLVFKSDDGFFYLQVIALVALGMKKYAKKRGDAGFVRITEFDEAAWCVNLGKPDPLKTIEMMKACIYQNWRRRLTPDTKDCLYETDWGKTPKAEQKSMSVLIGDLFCREYRKGPLRAGYKIKVDPSSIEVLSEDGRPVALFEALKRKYLSRGEKKGASPPRSSLRADLAKYYEQIRLDCEYADYRGIEGVADAPYAASVLLESIYVLPYVLPEAIAAEGQEAFCHKVGISLGSPQQEAEALSAVVENNSAVPNDAKRLRLAQALENARHVVILGGAGSGKTTLVRYLAATCALGRESVRNRLGWEETLTPILISPVSYADALSSDPELSLQHFLDRQMINRGGAALREAVREELASGNLFVLFDGVDEVSDYGLRSATIRAFERFVGDHGSCRFLVTSRPLGYVRLRGTAVHFTLAGFSSDDIQTFLAQWSSAIRRGNAKDSMAGRDLSSKLTLTEIQSDPRTYALAANPLMLTVMSLIRLREACLPRHRVQIYDQILNTLTHTWHHWRQPEKVTADTDIPSADRLIHMWARVAEMAHRHGQVSVMYRNQLGRWIAEIRLEAGIRDGDTSAEVDAYLAGAARAGLIHEREPGILAFWHPVFGDYLAAISLVTPPSDALRKILPLRTDPYWHDVISLAIAHLAAVQHEEEAACEVLRSIVEQDPPQTEFLHRASLRLALTCAREYSNCPSSVVEVLMARLAQALQTTPYEPLNGTFVHAVRDFPGLEPSPTTTRLLRPLSTHPDWRVRLSVARLVSNAAARSREAHRLCQVLLDDEIPDVRRRAAVGLARAGRYDSEVWTALSGSSRFSRDDEVSAEFLSVVCSSLPHALGQILAARDPDTHNVFLRLLRDQHKFSGQIQEALLSFLADDRPRMRVKAARLALELGDCSLEVHAQIAASLRPCLSALQPETRLEAVETIRRTYERDDHVLEQTTEAVRSCLVVRRRKLRLEAARRLHFAGQGDENVARALISCLNSRDLRVRVDAARLLHVMDRLTPSYKEALLPCLSSKNMVLRAEAADVLLSVCPSDPGILRSAFSCVFGAAPTLWRLVNAILASVCAIPDGRSVLLEFLSASDERLRYEAACMLLQLDKNDTEAVGALQLCLSAEALDIRFDAAEQLWYLGKADSLVARSLESCLASQDLRLRVDSIQLLTRLEKPNKAWLVPLLGCLWTDDRVIGGLAGRRLLDLRQADPGVEHELVSCLSASDPVLRVLACRLLVHQPNVRKEVTNSLRTCLSACDPLVRMEAVSHLHKMSLDDAKVVRAALECLSCGTRDFRYGVATMLHEMARSGVPVIEVATQMLLPDHKRGASACRRAAAGLRLAVRDLDILKELVCVRPDDTSQQRHVRQWVHGWIFEHIEPHAQGHAALVMP